MTNLDGN